MAHREVDLEELARRLAPAKVGDLAPLAGGASSLTFVGTLAGGPPRPVVVKVAPAGVAPVRNRDVLRQSRILRALRPTAVPVPEVVWEDPGDPPDVPPLFVMTHVPGTALEPLFDLDAGDGDERGPDVAATVAERMRAAARVLASLHALVPGRVGVAGEPAVGLDDEVERWSRVLETVDPALAPGWQRVAGALRAAQPPARPATIVHGDFRLGNTLAVGGRIVAVVDWEIWARADPRVDLGWFLVNADPETYRRPTRFVGLLPTPDDLLRVYREAGVDNRTDAPDVPDLPDLAWFQALACFKAAAVWALIVKHNRRRTAPDPATEAMVPTLPHLLERAEEHLRPT